MKTGTILENDHTNKDHPFHFSIYTGTSGKFVNFIYEQDGKIKRGSYYKEDVGKGKAIHPIGETDVLKRMAEMVRKEQGEQSRPSTDGDKEAEDQE